MTQSTVNFTDVVVAKLQTHPRFMKREADVITALAESLNYFDSWTSLANYGADGLVSDFELPADDAKALVNIANSEAAAQPALQVDAELYAEAGGGQDKSVDTAEEWRAMRAGQAPSGGIAAMVTNFNIRQEAVTSFGSAAYALFADAYGIDLALMELARRLMKGEGPRIKDEKAKAALFDYYSMKTEGDRAILSQNMREQAWTSIGGILDPRFDKLVGGSAAYAGLDTERQTMGAMVIAGGQQMSLNDLIRLVSPLDELITTGMDKGFVGPLTNKVIAEHDQLAQPLLTNRAIQVAYGIDYNEANPLISGAELLSAFGMGAVNAVRAGVAYRNFINSMALAAVKRPDAGLIILMGNDAADILTFGSMLNLEGASEVAADGASFQQYGNVPTSGRSSETTQSDASSTSRGWKISLKLGIKFTVGRK